MAEIPNDRYITVKRNADGEIVVLVGEKNATTYYGQGIWNIVYVKEIFAWMQKQNPEIEEWHIGAFATAGEYAKVGNPSGEFGPNAWCRVKKKNSSAAPWVFYYTYTSAVFCANGCAYRCALNVRDYASFRGAVLGSAIDKAKNDNAQGGMSPVTAPVAKIGDEYVIKLPNLGMQLRLKLEELQR